MESVNVALRLLATSQLLLFALLIVPSKNPVRVRLVAVLLMVAFVSYLIMPLLEYRPSFSGLGFFWYPSNISPSLLLLLVWFIFEEKCILPLWLVLTVGFGVLSSLWFHWQGIGLPDSPLWLQASKVIISLFAIAIVWMGRDNDLVELRFKVRNLFVYSLGLTMSVVLSVNTFLGFSTPTTLDLVELSIIFAFTLVSNYLFIKLNPQFQLMAEPVPIKEDSEDKVIVELLERMRSERLYADHDLRVGSLASMMKIPEYKLRTKINQQLGYRNFNQFVNRYRIDEASVKLLEDSRTPVLTIALDVGFRSISSFNAAFQDQFGVSPTKYRSETSLNDPNPLPES